MRRLCLALTLILCLPAVFAATTIGENQNGQFNIRGFYDGAVASECTFRLWSGSSTQDSDRIYQSGFVSITDIQVERSYPIFNWKLEWTTNTSYTLTFTFSPLQSYVEKTYFIPAHTFTMVCGNSTNTAVYDTKASGNYRYTSTYSGNYQRTISYTTNANANPRELSGSCKLMINDYETELAADFEYISYITVEFKTT